MALLHLIVTKLQGIGADTQGTFDVNPKREAGVMASMLASGTGPSAPRYSAYPLPEYHARDADECLDYVAALLQSLLHATPHGAQPGAPGGTVDGADDGAAPRRTEPASYASAAARNGLHAYDGPPARDGAAAQHPVVLPLAALPTDANGAKVGVIQSRIEHLAERMWAAEERSGAPLDGAARTAPPPGRAPASAPVVRHPAQSPPSAGERQTFRKSLPYPLSNAQPQSSAYPLSYPMGMGDHGPVLLSCNSSTSPRRGCAACERQVGADARGDCGRGPA